MPVDREALAADLLPHLRSTGHLIDLARRPDGGGGNPDSGYVPYSVLWPQPTVYEPTLSDAHRGDSTVMQITSVAADPDLAMKVAKDMRTLALSPPSTLAGRNVVQVRIVLDRGPDRDPQDQRLWFCILQPSVQTFA